MMFDHECSAEQQQRSEQCIAKPGLFGPPEDSPLCQYRGDQRQRWCEQGEGEEIQRLEGLDSLPQRQLEHHHRRQRAERQAALEHIEAVPFAHVQQRRRQQPGQRRAQLGNAEPENHRLRQVRFAERLQHVEQRQRTRGGRRQTAGGTHEDRHLQPFDEDMGDGQQRIQQQPDLGEAPQAVLLAELDQQQIGGNIDHEIGRRQPGTLRRRQPEIALDARQVGDDQRIAQPAGDPHQHRDTGIGDAHRHRMQQDRWRTGHGWAFMGLPAGNGRKVFRHFAGLDGVESG